MNETIYRAFPEEFALAVANCQRAIETRIIVGRVRCGLPSPDPNETPHLNPKQRASAIAYGKDQYGDGRKTLWARMMADHPNLQEKQLKFERIIQWPESGVRRDLILTPLPRGL